MPLPLLPGEKLPVVKYRTPYGTGVPTLSRPDALALEIALQEEAERHALEGEMAAEGLAAVPRRTAVAERWIRFVAAATMAGSVISTP